VSVPSVTGLVVGLEEPVELRSPRFHALRQFRLGKTLVCHEGVKLTRDHAFDGARGHLLVDAVFFQSSNDDPMRPFFFM
jgi:hypothetical protein